MSELVAPPTAEEAWVAAAFGAPFLRGDLKPKVVKYSENQPRDERGRFAGGPGSSLAVGDGQPYGAPFSQDQRSAIWRYTQYDYGVNGWLRGHTFEGGADEGYPKMAADLASACRPTEEALSVVRGVGREAFGVDAVESHDIEVDDRLHSLIGQTIRDPGFMSCTTNEATYYYDHQEIHLHLTVPEGTPVLLVGDAGASGYRDEQEHILAPGTGIRIDRVETHMPEGWRETGTTWDVYGAVVR